MTLLEVEGLSMSFSGLKALDGVSFAIDGGEITGLIGPNGAGKTTLLNCLSRVHTPHAGQIRFDGQDVLARPIHRMAELGICRTFQNLELFDEATVYDNVLIGCVRRYHAGLLSELLSLPAARAKAREAQANVEAILAELELEQYGDRRVSDLPFAVQKRVELARALAGRPRLLLLDEPAAGMNTVESQRQAETIRHLRDDHGITVLLVEHDMALVMSVCDHIVALDHGVKICEGPPDTVRTDPDVIRAYLGEEVADA